MKIVWVEWRMIRMVRIGLKWCEKLKLPTPKRVQETKLKFNFKLKKLDQNFQNHKGQNKDYPIFKIIANYHQWPQVQLEVLNLT